MRQASKKTRTPERQPAAVPNPSSLIAVPPDGFLQQLPLSEAYVKGLRFLERQLPELALSSSLIEHSSFSGATISAARWRDVRFHQCDFSNSVLLSCDARRVEFIDCRLTGLRAPSSRWHDVLFQSSDLRYAQFAQSALHSSDFVTASLVEADLVRAHLDHVTFQESSINGTDLAGATLRHTDLRGASIQGLQVTGTSLRTCRITAAQAIELAALQGLIVS